MFKYPLRINTLTIPASLFYIRNLGIHYTRILT